MTNDEIKALARECFDDRRFAVLTYETGPYDVTEPSPDLIRFARACIAQGLEMGARTVEAHGDAWSGADALRDMAAEMRK